MLLVFLLVIFCRGVFGLLGGGSKSTYKKLLELQDGG